MGTLTHVASRRSIELPARCIAGRAALAHIRLTHASVSREHAVIEWHHGCWRVRDLGSRNGTAVNAARCSSEYCDLAEGDVVAFGDEEERWQLTDAGPPPPSAVTANGSLRVGRGDLLVLPDDEAPTHAVYAAGDGWMLDDGDEVRVVRHGDAVVVDGRRWELLLSSSAGMTTETRPRWQLEHVTAIFEFNRSEEHVRITLRHPDGEEILPDRSFHYMLLVLARARVDDAATRGASTSEAGWVETRVLADKLRVTVQKINLDVFRARRLLAGRAIAGAASIVERRPPGQLRFGILRVTFREP